MIRTTPWRLMILQCSQRVLTDGLTFIARVLAPRFQRRLFRRNPPGGGLGGGGRGPLRLHALALDDLAVLAARLDRRSHLHRFASSLLVSSAGFAGAILYLNRYVMRPRVRSYGDSSTFTRSPGRIRMKFIRILPLTCASTRWPLSSSTRNIAFGNGSTTVPSTSIASSFVISASAPRARPPDR